jgi:hypothetical protein
LQRKCIPQGTGCCLRLHSFLASHSIGENGTGTTGEQDVDYWASGGRQNGHRGTVAQITGLPAKNGIPNPGWTTSANTPIHWPLEMGPCSGGADGGNAQQQRCRNPISNLKESAEGFKETSAERGFTALDANFEQRGGWWLGYCLSFC